jgi:hypothetical protein
MAGVRGREKGALWGKSRKKVDKAIDTKAGVP